MLSTIIEKEIRDVLVSTRFAISFGLSAILILLCFLVAISSYKSNMARYDAARAERQKSLEGLTDWSEFRDNQIFFKPRPLASLVTGISNDIGWSAQMEAQGEVSAADGRYSEDPVFAVFRFLDLEFIFSIVLSLFAMVMGYDAVCGEKERGTLRLAFANPVPRGKFILGKMAGLFLALAVPLLIVFAIGALLLPLSGVPMAGTDWLRLGLIILTGIIYIGAFLSLAVFISATTSRSAISFLALLVIWISSVMIIPRIAVLLAGRSIPMQTAEEISVQKNQLSSQLFDDDSKKLSDYVAPPEDDPQKMAQAFSSYMDSLAEERDNKVNDLGARLYEERSNRQRQQERLAFGLAAISPTASLTLAVTDLAGSALSLKDAFQTEAGNYQKEFAKFIKEKTGGLLGRGGVRIRIGGPAEGQEDESKRLDLSEIPSFEYKGRSLASAVSAAIPYMSLLVIFNLIFFAGAFLFFLRYDVR